MEVAMYTSEEKFLQHMEYNQNGNLLLISTSKSQPKTTLLKIGSSFEMEINFIVDAHHAEFGKLQDKVVGTLNCIATVRINILFCKIIFRHFP